MNELVKINENNQVTTDSLTVADRFGKRHSDVLRSIKMLKCSKEFGERNFALSSYITEQGKEQPYYDMTYDGWMFLVMGFTGEKAAEWKEKFIKAFRAMEAVVRENRTTENNIRTAVRQELAVLTSESATDTDMQDMRNLLAALMNNIIDGRVKNQYRHLVDENSFLRSKLDAIRKAALLPTKTQMSE